MISNKLDVTWNNITYIQRHKDNNKLKNREDRKPTLFALKLFAEVF